MINAILVDTDLLEMNHLANVWETLPHTKVVRLFTSPLDALDYVQQGNPVELALLAIDMQEMNGLTLCEKLRELHPKMLIVLITSHAEDALSALHWKADGILCRPYGQIELDNLLARINLLRARLEKRIYCHTFGHFDVFIDDKPILFKSAKAKEILALCVYRQGAPVSIEEIIDKLWENYSNIPGKCSTFRTALKSLTDTLREYGCDTILTRGRGFCLIQKDQIDSDYYDFLRGDADAICEFQGEFMSDYSWGSLAVYTLTEKKKIMNLRIPPA